VARIVSYEEGALGTVKAVAEDGSLFRFKSAYDATGLFAAPVGVRPEPPLDIPDELLSAAVEATEAEARALSLLARAEQFRFGLELKLASRGAPKAAAKAALDRLEAEGLLSDERYAESWIRQRCRSRAEGPRSLSASLSSRGVDRRAIKTALSRAFEGEARGEAIARAAASLAAKGFDTRRSRAILIELGWRSGEVDDAIDAIEQ